MSRPRGAGMVPRGRLLPAADQQPPQRREMLLEAITRVVHPSVLVVAVYLLLVGLHRPGGGFAAGLVAGLGLVLRRLAGGLWELGVVAPWPPGVLLGVGLSTVVGYGIAGALLTGEFLTGQLWHLSFGPLGVLSVPSALVFELGIVLIVLGLVVDVLRTLGAHDRPMAPGGDSEPTTPAGGGEAG